MKILYDYQIFCYQRMGGVSRYFIELIKELSLMDAHEIEIPVFFNRNEYLSEYKGISAFPDRRLLYNKYTINILDCINQRITLKKINDKNIDIIHPTWIEPYVYSVKKCKKIITICDMIHEIMPNPSNYTKTEIRKKKEAIEAADHIIAISNSTKNDLLRFYPHIAADKISVVYLGTNHLTIRSDRCEQSFPERYILYVGKRAGYKGFNRFITTVSKLVRDYDDLFIVIAGGGILSEEEKQLLSSLKISEKVKHYILSDDELAHCYNNALVFVYPSEYEGFGFPILEAFDNNCPVICTNSSSLPEVGGEAALYYDISDDNALINLVETMIEDEKFRRSYKEKGREQINRFTWEKTAEETLQVYNMVLGQ